MDLRGRPRRPSAQSITMSSGSNSRASSIGPSSFTENLTLYMNGQRDPIFPIEAGGTDTPAALIGAPNDDNSTKDTTSKDSAMDALSKNFAKANIDSIMDGESDLQTLRDELQAALRRHDELMAENERLKTDLEAASVKALRVDPLEKELAVARAESESSLPQLETAQRQLDVARLRTEELEADLSKQAAETQKAKEQVKTQREKVDALQMELERREARDRDDSLDDQSTIDELEDELERTQQELDRSIKERQRVERQLEFVKGDYEAEKQRVGELQGLLVAARRNEKERDGEREREKDPTPEQTLSGRAAMGRESSPRAELSSQEVEGLRAAMERAEFRIDGLESQLKDARSAIQSQSEQFAATTKGAEQRAQEQQDRLQERFDAQLQAQREAQEEAQAHAQSRTSPSTPETSSPMDRAEAYIRKLKIQESELKQNLRDAMAERDELRVQLRDTEDELKEFQDEVGNLTKRIQELEDMKERMGRVLMYQWGKEEVGEIEKSRSDGKRERGMGFRYKYFNKDGSVKRGGKSE